MFDPEFDTIIKGLMGQTISVRFFARKGRTASDGLIPLTMRIGLNRQRISISTRIRVKESEWSIKEGRLISVTRWSKKINGQLDGFKVKAFDCQRALMNEGKPITLENIKAKWLGTSTEKAVMLMDVFAQHNQRVKELVDKEFSPLTLERV